MKKQQIKTKADIDLVMELNESLKTNKKRLEDKLAQNQTKLDEQIKKEKSKMQEIEDSLNETDEIKVRNSKRLQT